MPAVVERDLIIKIKPDHIDEERESIVLKLWAYEGTFPDGDDADSLPDETMQFKYHIKDDDMPEWTVDVTAPETVQEGTGTSASDGNTARIMVTAYRAQTATPNRSYNFRWEAVVAKSTATTDGDLQDFTVSDPLVADGTLRVWFPMGGMRSRPKELELMTVPDFALEPDEKIVIRLKIPPGDGLFSFPKPPGQQRAGQVKGC